MANIRVDLSYNIFDGAEVSFKSPADCSAVTGLRVYYVDTRKQVQFKEFKFADAHGNDVTDIDTLFGENAIVKVILDVTNSRAFVQNADTNAYLEGRFKALEDADAKDICCEEGVHGIRYYNGRLQVKVDGKWKVGVKTHSIFGVDIDLANPNPQTAVTYTDDAVGMVPGSADWDSMPIFNAIRPCVLKGGVVQYYLNPENFAQKEDGSDSDITTIGNDVMIEIPKTGVKIYTVGNILSVRITDNCDGEGEGFRYYAHSRYAEGDRDKLYLSAYLASPDEDYSMLYSYSGGVQKPYSLADARGMVSNRGAGGYGLMSFHALTLLQCLFLIRYKTRDCVEVFPSFQPHSIVSGNADSAGMYCAGEGGVHEVKFAGLESVCQWNNNCWVDNISSDSFGFVINYDTWGTEDMQVAEASLPIQGHLSVPQGTTEAGFLAKEAGGSETTHFACFVDAPKDAACYTQTGSIFGLVSAPSSSSVAYSRIMYMDPQLLSDGKEW